MTTRTVTGTLYHPVGGTVWVGASLAFTLLTPFGSGTSSYPGETTTATTDGSGNFSTALVVPDDAAAAARYRVSISATGVAATVFEFNLASGASINLATLLIESVTTATPNSLQALIDTHAAIAATASVLGHIKVGTALGISSGVLSGIPATIPFRIQHATSGGWAMPLALTEWNGSTAGRIKADLTNATQARLILRMGATPGISGAELRAQYSTDESSWSYLDGAAGPACAVNVASVTVVSGWVNLVAGAKADVFLRIIGINGDGGTAPTFGNFSLQVR